MAYPAAIVFPGFGHCAFSTRVDDRRTQGQVAVNMIQHNTGFKIWYGTDAADEVVASLLLAASAGREQEIRASASDLHEEICSHVWVVFSCVCQWLPNFLL